MLLLLQEFQTLCLQASEPTAGPPVSGAPQLYLMLSRQPVFWMIFPAAERLLPIADLNGQYPQLQP